MMKDERMDERKKIMFKVGKETHELRKTKLTFPITLIHIDSSCY